MAAKKGGLGKGLDAIFSENDMEDRNAAVAININEIEPNRAQPRKSFDDASLADLAESIAQHGVLQPLLVRPLIGGGYQIVAGERRWRAARMAGVQEVPAVVRDLSESEVMQLALIENLQREDLNPLEEAGGYQALMEEYGFTQEDVARTVLLLDMSANGEGEAAAAAADAMTEAAVSILSAWMKEEQAAALPDVLPARRTAGAMVIGSLGFFLCLALRAWEDARSGTEAACRSASANLWASLFVLLAALLRFLDLRNQTAEQDGSEAGTLPA